ncbi:hypothetical protein FB567DRAFT_444307 [Paraphoma chrysanthemicola]|uniref:Uncharacterized protein n=1 Tax=Paraphoma chrysanthemicola TaxID=798071 RepID=A0A8K0VXL9_9PLEO|nr:hypothetical protein FB567DRAFT_444307 [Paraphoma chrysanthemicola]
MATETALEHKKTILLCPTDSQTKGIRQGFLNTVIRLSDGSSWKLVNSLSHAKYQQMQPPFEAREVFESVCVHDPNEIHSGAGSAIVKVKFQIKGCEEALKEIETEICSDRAKLAEESDPKRRRFLLRELEIGERMLYNATHPITTPNGDTLKEVQALQKFHDTQCATTPHSLDVVGDWQPPGVDRLGMPWGFSIFIVMTKVPGERVTSELLKNMTLDERNEVRASFKKAIMEVWKRGFCPDDCAMRNLMWDKETRTCYIVDFEDYSKVNIKDPEAWWEDRYYQNWEIDEETLARYWSY